VQYPGAGAALTSDLDQISRLGRVFGTLAPGLDMKPLLAELRERVVEELDYSLEAESQRQFAAAYADDVDFVVPDVVAQSGTVLVTQWAEGASLATVIADGSTEQRDALGTKYLRFLFSGPARAGLLHADPHPGNYRVMADGRLGVLDFGAVARVPGGLPPSIGRLLSRALVGDAEAVRDGLRDEGFIKPGVRIEPEALVAYLNPFIEPARVERFRFDRPWMRAQFARINDPRQEYWSTGLKLNLPPEYLLVHRVWLGGVGVLCQLGAEVPMRAELERWLPGYADGPTP
jgi:predicted unusual protein kinase regulating ubiquinone biosynthesis (AarF/ABC1/UbiB family)